MALPVQRRRRLARDLRHQADVELDATLERTDLTLAEEREAYRKHARAYRSADNIQKGSP